MKRTFLAKRNALLTSSDVSWGALALVAVILLLLLRFIAPNMFLKVVTPAFHFSNALTTASHSLFSSFGDTGALTLQNERLLQENTALTNENKALLEKIASSGELSDTSVNGIRASVVSRPPTSPYDTFVLSEGSKAGVTLGQEAFGAGGVPLGVVSSVLPDFSRVTLFSSPTMTVDGWVGHTHLPLTLQGVGGGALSASLARSANVVVGDEVFTSGPGTLPIGSVTRIDSDPSSPLVTLRIQSALNLFSVTVVELRDTGSAFATTLSWPTP